MEYCDECGLDTIHGGYDECPRKVLKERDVWKDRALAAETVVQRLGKEYDMTVLQNAEMRKEIAIAIPFLKSRLAWKPTKPFEDVINTLEKFLDKPKEESETCAHVACTCPDCKKIGAVCEKCDAPVNDRRDGH